MVERQKVLGQICIAILTALLHVVYYSVLLQFASLLWYTLAEIPIH